MRIAAACFGPFALVEIAGGYRAKQHSRIHPAIGKQERVDRSLARCLLAGTVIRRRRIRAASFDSMGRGLGASSRDRRRIEMGKLIATTQATVDGVVDPVGEWVQPDGDHGDYSFERQARSSGLVLGRKTYEGLAGYWPSQSGKWADMVNAMPKYVGSTTLSGDLEWNATLLEGHLEDSIPKLKDEVAGDLFMHGSGEFAYALAQKGLIDEYEVYLNPLVWGKGNVHVLGDRGTVRMELDDVKRFVSGVVLLTYLPES
jgi:dihydrofolate reductase